jgi:hypothetical protein
MNDERMIAVKRNDDDRWSYDDMVLWSKRRQNGDAFKWWGEWSILR